MKREFLKTLLPDITDEQLDAIMAEHGKTVKDTADQLKAITAERDNLAGQLQTATEGLQQFEGVDVSALNGKIEELQNQITAQRDEFEFESALTAEINAAKGRNAKAIRAMLEVDALKASKERTSDIKAALEALRESDAYLFAEDEVGASGVTGSTGGEHGTGGDVDYDAMTDAEWFAAQKKGD